MKITMETKNQSFLDMHKYLDALGIKNSTFMLRLDNLHLKKVDPFSPDLKEDVKRAIIEEACKNVWYFLRELVRVPSPGGGSEPFQLNRSILPVIFLYEYNKSSWNTSPRQTRKSLTNICLGVHDTIVVGNSTSIISTRTDNNALSKSKFLGIISNLPEYIRETMFRSPETISTRSKIKMKTLAAGAARDSTSIIFSDAEYIKHIDIAVNAIYESHLPGYRPKLLFDSCISDSAKDNGALDVLGSLCYDWEDWFYDLEPDIIKATDKIAHINYTYDDIGWFDKRDEMIILLNGNEDAIRREVDLKRKVEDEQYLYLQKIKSMLK